MRLTVEAACGCHIGLLRKRNEDNYFFDGKYLAIGHNEQNKTEKLQCRLKKGMAFAVFDGMGGEKFGEQASYAAAGRMKRTVEALAAWFPFPKKYMQCLTTQLNAAVVCEQEKYHTYRMGTTMVSLYFSIGYAYICNVGDSRAYCFRNGELMQLSVDHVAKRPGGENKKEPLTRYLGTNPDEVFLEPSIARIKIKKDDKYLICSDGLTDMLSEIALSDIMGKNSSAEDCVEQLLQKALEQGGRDNITAIVCLIE